jgi:hypothetical protein
MHCGTVVLADIHERRREIHMLRRNELRFAPRLIRGESARLRAHRAGDVAADELN